MFPWKICWLSSTWFKASRAIETIRSKKMGVLDDLRDKVIGGDLDQTRALVQQAVTENMPAEQILKEGLISAMAEVGRSFESGEIFVPEMLISARAMKGGLALLRPYLIAANVQAVGTVIIGTVQGDLHDIGKNLVGMMLEGASFQVIDLGTDVPPEKYVQAVREHHPELVACSALLTTTMPRMKDTIHSLDAAGLRRGVKVMVGGAPLTEEYARDIGADLYAPDAAAAATRAQELILRLRQP
jgi:5-methyltetrahydrofolate--homocysteine methyltransferase